jgi:hypothetical protein
MARGFLKSGPKLTFSPVFIAAVDPFTQVTLVSQRLLFVDLVEDVLRQTSQRGDFCQA